ncbi:hypothetical protein LguiA_017114 [Lonicera macranthoides]
MFSLGQDSAWLMVSSDILHDACASICKTTCNRDLNSVCYQVYERVPNGKILAFRSPPDCTVQNLEHQGKDLVPSSTFGTMFDFIATKVNRSFSIHKAAAEVFSSLHAQLSKLKDEIDIFNPLIITGNSLGGSIASLYTLWLLDTIYSNPTKGPRKPKRPICITFGAPLLGDIHLQCAIYERPSWTPCFLHVVSNQDPIPKLFVRPHAALSTEPTSLATPTYMPFGSFLFCSESGCARFDHPNSVFELLEAMSSEDVGNYDASSDLLICYYGMVLGCLKEKAICSGVSELGEGFVNPLRVGLTLQLEAIGITKTQQQQQDNRMKTLIEKVEKRQEEALKLKRYVMDPKKKLNEIKKCMAHLEWYKMKTVDQGGYYDAYKNADTRDRKISKETILKHQKILGDYWKDMVRKADQMPQKEGVFFHTSWLFAAITYKRMVEPLDIAYWYMQGKSNYINSGRSEHYKLMEKWFDDDKKSPSQASNSSEGEKPSLTEDSCFWAHVEEAVISIGVLKDGSSQENKEFAKQNLIKFEDYVMGLIGHRAVSPEIFLENSTFMKWWESYEKIMGGTSYKSLLADFMRNDYKRYV